MHARTHAPVEQAGDAPGSLRHAVAVEAEVPPVAPLDLGLQPGSGGGIGGGGGGGGSAYGTGAGRERQRVPQRPARLVSLPVQLPPCRQNR